MQALTLKLNKDQSYFLIKIRKNIDSYLKNKIDNSSGFVVVKDNTVSSVSLQFDLILEDDNKITRLDSQGLSKRRKETFLQFKSLSYERINDDLSFLKVSVTLNDITKIVELEAFVKTEIHQTGPSKVVFEIVTEIDKKDFGLGVDEQISINGLAFGKNINATGNFEFLSD
ncbi:YceI family protein [Flavobacterium ardleyense]|uniref:YceI family protein n=1 Tax=Flavobacterium ardleyense TaxID=2038737 RepID=A0ABW5Z9L8_9FLAO